MPSSRPRIVFKGGVCNACIHADERRLINWDDRLREFKEVVNEYRGRGAYDCVVPFSGGKDSATIAHKLKYEHNLNPLLVCYGQMLWTDVGRRNLHRVADAGLDILYWRTNQEVSRRLARRFLIERMHIKQHYDAAVNAVPVRTAINFNIPLIFYAEHGESFYGGQVLSEEHRRTRDLAEVLENQVGDDARNWAVDGITERDLHPYIYPDEVDIKRVGVKAFYYSYFFPWSIYDNAMFAKERMDFEWIDPRSDGSFESYDSIDDMVDGVDFYGMWLKFGFGRATRMASRLIQDGRLTRDEGLELVRKYDGEYPEMYLGDVLDYIGMTVSELHDLFEKHKNPEIWDGDKLRYPPK